MKNRVLNLEDSRGSVLIITLLILMIGSLIAVYATNTSTTETRVATNEKSYTSTFYAADAGVDPGASILLDIFNNRAAAASYGGLTPLTGTIDGGGNNLLVDVVMGYDTTHIDRGYGFKIPGSAVATSITYERQGATTSGSGSSAEFGAGSEGTGYGSSSGVLVYYFVRPKASQDSSGALVTLETMYRKVSNVGEGK